MIEFNTETERFLYEERKQIMLERNQALEELNKLKEQKKKESNFSVYMLSILDENVLWHHPTDGRG